MKYHWISLLSVTAALATSAALAAPSQTESKCHPGHGFAAMVERLDANADGKITRQEAQAAQLERFHAADQDGDGSLSPEEARALRDRGRARHQEQRGQRFAQRDTNKDGRLSKEETRMPGERFALLDADHDGYLTQEELQAARAAKTRDQQPSQERASRFERLDLNHDGRLSVAEASAAADRIFSRLDRNQDGVISQQELPRHRAGQRGHGAQRGARTGSNQ